VNHSKGAHSRGQARRVSHHQPPNERRSRPKPTYRRRVRKRRVARPRIRLALTLAFIAALIGPTVSLADAYQAERASSCVSIALPWTSIDSVVNRAPRAQVDARLQQIKQAGVTHVVVPVAMTMGVLEDYGGVALYARGGEGEFVRSELSVLPASATKAAVLSKDVSPAYVFEALEAAYGLGSVYSMDIEWGGETARVFYGTWDSHLHDVFLGFDEDIMVTLERSGLRAVLSVGRIRADAESYLVDRIDSACETGIVDGVLFRGPLPSPSTSPEAEHLRTTLKQNDIPLVAIETFGSMPSEVLQAGIYENGQATGWDVVRLHDLPVDPESDRSLSVRSLRAVRERNIRMVAVQPAEGVGLEVLTEAVASVSEILSPRFRMGTAQAFDRSQRVLLVDLLIVIAASLIPVVFGWLQGPRAMIWASVFLLLWGVAALLAFPPATATWPALIATTVAVLAVTAPVPSKSLAGVVSGYLTGFGITVLGGLILHAYGSTPASMLGFDRFEGVKFVMMAPGIAVVAGAVEPLLQILSELRARGSRRLVLIVLGLFALAVYVYVSRSGNSGFMPAIEGYLRDALDYLLPIRPRFKELLVGFPALALSIWLRKRTSLGKLVSVVATVGTAGAVTSFVHYHTPAMLSLVRTMISGGVGLALGLLLIMLVNQASRRTMVRSTR